MVTHEIEKLINKLDINKSSDPNSIPMFILKFLKPFFSVWLSKLINLSYETDVLPDLLKIAKVVPIHKEGSKFDHKNHHPISKIYEKVLYKRIYEYLTINELFYEKQYRFRSKHSTNHALIRTTLQEFL